MATKTTEKRHLLIIVCRYVLFLVRFHSRFSLKFISHSQNQRNAIMIVIFLLFFLRNFPFVIHLMVMSRPRFICKNKHTNTTNIISLRTQCACK